MIYDNIDTMELLSSLAELLDRGVIEVFSCSLDTDRLAVYEASSSDGEYWELREVQGFDGGYEFETSASSAGFLDRMQRGIKGV